jgi:hypothetical protein
MTRPLPERRPRVASAHTFAGFMLLIVTVVALAGRFNPDRSQPEFWVQTVITSGGLFAWALWARARLLRGRPSVAYAFLGTLTGLAALGAMIGMARGGYPPSPDTTGTRVMLTARAMSGLYLLIAWAVVAAESIRARKRTDNHDCRVEHH